MMAAVVVFDYTRQPVFATPEAAKARMATEQYARLKALLLSLKYASVGVQIQGATARRGGSVNASKAACAGR
jgi:hypothetical protein